MRNTPRTDKRCQESQKLLTMSMRFAWMCDHSRILERENAELLEAALFLLNEIDGEAFHQVGQANGEMLYEGVGKLRAVIDTVKKEAGDDAIMRQHLTEGGTPT